MGFTKNGQIFHFTKNYRSADFTKNNWLINVTKRNRLIFSIKKICSIHFTRKKNQLIKFVIDLSIF